MDISKIKIEKMLISIFNPLIWVNCSNVRRYGSGEDQKVGLKMEGVNENIENIGLGKGKICLDGKSRENIDPNNIVEI